MNNFKTWLETQERPYVQQLFPWMTEEDPLDWKKMARYKNSDSYVKSQVKGARDTENAAKSVISAPPGLWGEQLTDLWNNAVVVDTARGNKVHIAFANFKTIQHNGTETHRLLAFYQDENKNLTREEIMGGQAWTIGGIGYSNGYLTHGWISPIERKDKVLNLWKHLRYFARMYLGIHGTAPDDNLTSKSYRSSQARYDYNRFLKWKQNQP